MSATTCTNPDPTVWQQCPSPASWTPPPIDPGQYGQGGINLTASAVSEAGGTASPSETIHVDDTPPSISLAATNDADTNAWINHAVTIDASTSSGPSLIAGTNCAVDSAAWSAYPATGLTVNGTGTHIISCETWNHARDVNGSPATGSNSLAVKIDETPPTVSFEPENPSDPTSLVADTSDAESGVQDGQIQMRPHSGGAWQSLGTQFDGKHLLAQLDDAGLSGPYDFEATSCDRVGNCASTIETLMLPLRTPSSSIVSFQTVVDPLHTKRVRERIRVARYVVVRRHGRKVRVKRGIRYRTITVIKQVESCTHTRVRMGKQKWVEKTVCHPPRMVLLSTDRVPHGTSATVHGELTTAAGVPIADQPVEVLTAPDDNQQQFSTLAAVNTDANGHWTAVIPAGPSRLVEASFAGNRTIEPSTSSAVRLLVPASVILHISPRHLPWGGTVTISGQVVGGYIPSNPNEVSNLLRLRIGHGKQYGTVGIPLIDRKGDFRTTYTFDPGQGVAHFWFTVSTLIEVDYPFISASSKRITVRVGPG
jgi:hypothetical protein